LSINGRRFKKHVGHGFHFHRRRLGRKLKAELEEIITTLEKLRNDADEATVILVEGQKDKRALKQLGVTGRILSLQEFRKEIQTYLNAERVILLLDFDEEGMSMYKRLKTRLEQQGFRVETFYYNRLGEIRRFGVYTIEEMGRYLSKVMHS